MPPGSLAVYWQLTEDGGHPSVTKVPMCNAKNHRENCSCGFSGRRNLPRAALSGSATLDLFDALPVLSVPPVRRVRITPNARCPVCSNAIYFYDLVNTGRVYFDELGAPWPKHPCTDKFSEFNAGAVNGETASKWVTVLQIKVEVADEGMLRLSGKMPEGDLLVYLSKKHFDDASESAEFLGESFIQTRWSSSEKFDLALLTPDARPLLVAGYVTIADAVANS